LCLAVLLVGIAALDCSSDDPNRAVVTEGTGSVGLELHLAPGVDVDRVQYHLTGPNGFDQSGFFDVAQSTTISVILGGLRGPGSYVITFTATTVDGGINCAGSAPFDIIPRFTTTVTVHLTCQAPRNHGSVLVNGSLNICPVIDSFSAVYTNDGIQFSSMATDTDNGPTPLSFQWQVVSGPGVFQNPNVANPTLLCASAGTVDVRLTVSDGDPAPFCADSFAGRVFCGREATDSLARTHRPTGAMREMRAARAATARLPSFLPLSAPPAKPKSVRTIQPAARPTASVNPPAPTTARRPTWRSAMPC
jgi:hypothetical protein